MADWKSLVNAQADACLKAFGRDVVFAPQQTGVPAPLRAILTPGVEAEETDQGVYMGLFAKASAFPQPPARGDEITVDLLLYKIVDINADGEGGLHLLLRFHREII
ncbi:MAG TPA: hypothetical protein VNO52_16835 [Methylomirabilota bacterium]|nr:hypothetical protein [Methylomirabilota bacterium]